MKSYINHKVIQTVDHVDTSGHMTNKKHSISISTRPVATKLDRMVAYDKNQQAKESHVLLFTRSREVM